MSHMLTQSSEITQPFKGALHGKIEHTRTLCLIVRKPFRYTSLSSNQVSMNPLHVTARRDDMDLQVIVKLY